MLITPRAGQTAWYPKNESPILKELVAEKKLPPLEERIGPEPCVVEGVEGIGKYGGTFVAPVNNQGDVVFNYSNKFGTASLVAWSPQGYPIVPELAKSWTVSPDNKVYTFYLRKGVKWSDGYPFTADDIMYWWEKEALEPPDPEYFLGMVPSFLVAGGKRADIVKIDDYTIKIVFENPNSILIEHLASYGANMTSRPAHYLTKFHPRMGDKIFLDSLRRALKIPKNSSVYSYARGDAWTIDVNKPILGPYIYTTYRAVSPYAVVRNPYYWKVDTKGNQLPYIDRYVFLEKSAQSEGLLLTSGDLTIVGGNNAGIPLMEMEAKNGRYSLVYWTCNNASNDIIYPNYNRNIETKNDAKKAELIKNVTFKKALSISINRQEIIDAMYLGIGEPAQVFPPRGSLYYDSIIQKENTEYNPKEASRLLDSLGLDKRDREGYRTFKDGTRMSFFLELFVEKGLATSCAQFLIDDWNAVGLRIVPRERLYSLLQNDLRAMKHDLHLNSSEGEYIPLPMPACIISYNRWNSAFAFGYANWYENGGMWGDPNSKIPGNIEPPLGNPYRTTLELYDGLKKIYKQEDRVKQFKELMRISADNVFTIGISTMSPSPMAIKTGLKNVPQHAVTGDVTGIGGVCFENAGFSTYYFENPDSSRTVFDQIKKEIITKVPQNPVFTELANAKPNFMPIPGIYKAPVVNARPEEDKRSDIEVSESGRKNSIIKYFSIFGLLVIGLVLVSRRYPYIGKRLLLMIPTLLIISVITFTIIQLPPGDYITSLIANMKNSGYSNFQDVVESKKRTFNLDEPMHVQYFIWMGFKWFKTFNESDQGVLQGNLGLSMMSEQRVTDMWGERLLLSFILELFAIILIWSIAIPAGVFSAVRQYSIADYTISFVGFIGMSIPSFLLAIVVMFLSFKYFGISVIGLFSPKYGAQSVWDIPKFVDMLKHIWVPVLLVGIGGTAGMIRVLRANLLDELKKPYVITARAKGVRPVKLLFKYPFRMAINPFISGIGGIIPSLISGGGLVAIVLNLPTLDPLLLNALLTQDMYMAGSILFVLTTLGLIGVLVSDLMLLWLDPRIRYEGGSR